MGVLKAGLMFGTIVLVAMTAVRWGVRRKTRTSWGDSYYIEDSLARNGTRYRVLLGANDTGGEYFSVEVLMRKEAYGAVRGKPGCQPHHLHTQQKETVHVLNGTLGYYKGHHTHAAKLEAGGTVSFEPGEAHTLWNAGGGSAGGDLLLEVEHRPARYGEAFYETLAGLGYEYESPLAVSPIQVAITYHRSEAVLLHYSPGTWSTLTTYVVPFAEQLGYKPFYQQYTTQRDYRHRPTGRHGSSSGGGGKEGGGSQRRGGGEEEAEDAASDRGGGYLDDHDEE